jgi:hypothetical protein
LTLEKLLKSSVLDVSAISKGLAQGAQDNVICGDKAAPVLDISTATLSVKLNRQFSDEFLAEYTTAEAGSDIIAEVSYCAARASE